MPKQSIHLRYIAVRPVTEHAGERHVSLALGWIGAGIPDVEEPFELLAVLLALTVGGFQKDFTVTCKVLGGDCLQLLGDDDWLDSLGQVPFDEPSQFALPVVERSWRTSQMPHGDGEEPT